MIHKDDSYNMSHIHIPMQQDGAIASHVPALQVIESVPLTLNGEGQLNAQLEPDS